LIISGHNAGDNACTASAESTRATAVQGVARELFAGFAD